MMDSQNHPKVINNLKKISQNGTVFCEYIENVKQRFQKIKTEIESAEGLDNFSKSYEQFGAVKTPHGGVIFSEWAPEAHAVYLTGNFNGNEKWRFEKKPFGKFELYVHPNNNGTCKIPNLSSIKLIVETKAGKTLKRLSPWATNICKNNESGHSEWLFWNPPSHEQINSKPTILRELRISEIHMNNRTSTFKNLTKHLLPRIKDLEYNCILLKIHDTDLKSLNLFSVSSEYGTLEDLKKLIDIAHGMKIKVILDVAHHSTSESLENVNGGSYFKELDTSDENSEMSKTCGYDYSKWEVLRLLISNLRYLAEEYNVDGFRFAETDNIQSKCKTTASFRVYLMLANQILHQFYPEIFTFFEGDEDTFGACRSISEGGLGFDYKVKITTPMWTKLLNDYKDENWNMEHIIDQLANTKVEEKEIVCTEYTHRNPSDNESLIRQLLGNLIDTNMSIDSPLTTHVDRGLSLYKMIRLLTHSLYADSFLSVIGNEFKSPGTDTSNFQLCDNETSRYKFLNRFDRALNMTESKKKWLSSPARHVTRIHEDDKVIIYERANLLFLFNFHPTKSYPDYRVSVEHPGTYKIILDTDARFFGGHGRNQPTTNFFSTYGEFNNKVNSIMNFFFHTGLTKLMKVILRFAPFYFYIAPPLSNTFTVYLPSRCALVMENQHAKETSL